MSGNITIYTNWGGIVKHESIEIWYALQRHNNFFFFYLNRNSSKNNWNFIQQCGWMKNELIHVCNQRRKREKKNKGASKQKIARKAKIGIDTSFGYVFKQSEVTISATIVLLLFEIVGTQHKFFFLLLISHIYSSSSFLSSAPN